MSFAELESRLLEVLLSERGREAPFATPFDDRWRPLDAENAAHWLARTAVEMARKGEERPSLLRYKVVAVRQMEPAFYRNTRIVECWVENREGRYGSLYHLEHEGSPSLMQRHPQTIHRANFRERLSLADDQVADYLRFFCWFTWGDAGPFVVIDDPRLLPWTADAAADLRQSVAGRLRQIEPTVQEVPTSNDNSMLRCHGAWVTLIYDGSLFESEMRVFPMGAVAMVEDRLLMENLPMQRWLMTPHGARFQQPPSGHAALGA